MSEPEGEDLIYHTYYISRQEESSHSTTCNFGIESHHCLNCSSVSGYPVVCIFKKREIPYMGLHLPSELRPVGWGVKSVKLSLKIKKNKLRDFDGKSEWKSPPRRPYILDLGSRWRCMARFMARLLYLRECRRETNIEMHFWEMGLIPSNSIRVASAKEQVASFYEYDKKKLRGLHIKGRKSELAPWG